MWNRAWEENGENWQGVFRVAEEAGEPKKRADAKHRDRMIAYLLEALGLGPNLSEPDLFAVCQGLVSGAARKEEKLEADLNLLQGACARRGIPVGSFRPEPRARSRPPPP
eukprot:4777283-Alexandrium_andersonii.AAC.1